MDPGAATAGESLLSRILALDAHCRGVRAVTASGGSRAGEVFGGMRREEKRPRFDAGREAEHPPPDSQWAGLQPDALGIILRFLPCRADRARVLSVCGQWRAAARGHGVPPPLPLLVLPKFRFSSLTPGGALTAARRAWMPAEVAADRARCLGSSDEWLVGVRNVDAHCFLVNAFSHELIHLPPLSAAGFSYPVFMRELATDGYSEVHCPASGWQHNLLIRKAALSASPGSGSKCIAVVLTFRRSIPELALWKPGMTSWHVCRDPLIAGHIDIAFYGEKLYMLWRFSPGLFAFELGDNEHGVNVSRVEDCFIERLVPNPLEHNGALSYNIAVWGGKLLLIIRYYGCYRDRNNVVKVEVFALEFSTKPYGLTEIHSLGGDCIFVGSGGCKSFPASLHDEVEGDLIYFVPDDYNTSDTFVYSMSDGRVRPLRFLRPLPVNLSPINFGAPEDNLDFPVWLFPSE
ncbi:hypothetical protein ACP70R_007444 [Stipagrostis hirtigluma subsp. patula]